MANLKVNLGGMEMINPVMPASGAYDYFEYKYYLVRNNY